MERGKERVLITGVTGFVGSHLSELLLGKGLEIYGIERWRSKTENIEHIKDKIKSIKADIRDAHSMEDAIKKIEPNYIFHLAAQSFVPMSWNAPVDTLETNIIGTVNLFEAVRKAEIDPKIHIAGSSEEYGMVYPNEIPIKETNPLRPLSPYGVSKVAQDKLSYQYFKSYGLKIVVTRAFNHTGPRRGEAFVSSNFSKQVVEMEKGLRKPVINVGNLDAKRDFSDVRDIVRGYWLAVNKCDFGEVYNLCSGKATSIKELLDLITSLSKVKGIKIIKDPTRIRPSDVPVLQGDYTKFRKKTGWKPEIPFKKTIEDLMNYWRDKL
jgi:GDP-4-dehydro-6-deoxy-D-mannose reductase